MGNTIVMNLYSQLLISSSPKAYMYAYIYIYIKISRSKEKKKKKKKKKKREKLKGKKEQIFFNFFFFETQSRFYKFSLAIRMLQKLLGAPSGQLSIIMTVHVSLSI